MPSKLLCDHDVLFETAHQHAGVEMERFTVASECKRLVLTQLISMNLTAAALFPGIDGIAKSIRELALIADLTK